MTPDLEQIEEEHSKNSMIISHISSQVLSDANDQMLIQDQGGEFLDLDNQIFSGEDDNVHHYLTHFEEIKEENPTAEAEDDNDSIINSNRNL